MQQPKTAQQINEAAKIDEKQQTEINILTV